MTDTTERATTKVKACRIDHQAAEIERLRTAAINDGTIVNFRIEDFCAHFGVSRRSAFVLINEGEIEAIKIGARTVITAESARAWRARCPRIVPAALRRHQERKTPTGGKPAGASGEIRHADAKR